MVQETEKKKASRRKQNSKILIFGGALLILMAPFLLTRNAGFESFLNTGQIGDTIGGITSPIVGIIGAILVYYALLEQIEANKIINDQFSEQKKMAVQQNFENTFFNLLNIHHQIVNNIDFESRDLILEIDKNLGKTDRKSQKEIFDFNYIYSYDKKDFEKANGRKFFEYTIEAFMHMLAIYDKHYLIEQHKEWNVFTNMKTDEEFKSYFEFVFYKFYIKLDTHLGHYFRNLYRIIKMIDEQPFYLTKDEEFKKKYFYTSIVRSQLSDYEIKWLFYNGLFEFGFDKFKPLMEKYTLLKNLSSYNEEDITKFMYIYDESAFIKKH